MFAHWWSEGAALSGVRNRGKRLAGRLAHALGEMKERKKEVCLTQGMISQIMGKLTITVISEAHT